MGRKLLIRPWQAGDLAQIARLYHATVRTINARDYSPAQIRVWSPRAELRRFWAERFARRDVLVAIAGRRVVGFAELDTATHIDCFYVHVELQGQGAGSNLLTGVEQLAAAMGAAALSAEASTTAVAFFVARGYRVSCAMHKLHRGMLYRQFAIEKSLRNEG